MILNVKAMSSYGQTTKKFNKNNFKFRILLFVVVKMFLIIYFYFY